MAAVRDSRGQISAAQTVDPSEAGNFVDVQMNPQGEATAGTLTRLESGGASAAPAVRWATSRSVAGLRRASSAFMAPMSRCAEMVLRRRTAFGPWMPQIPTRRPSRSSAIPTSRKRP